MVVVNGFGNHIFARYSLGGRGSMAESVDFLAGKRRSCCYDSDA